MIYAKQVLKPGYKTTARKGFYADVDEMGLLRHFGFYRDGEPVGWTVDIEGDRVSATRKVTREYESVEEIIDTIYRDSAAEHRVCLFCGKTDAEVAVMVAGPDRYSFICDECIQTCAAILQDRKEG